MVTRKPSQKDPRVPKTLHRKLDDLQYHSHQIRELLGGLRHSEEHIKALAAELRVLLCLSGKMEGLLWRLLDELHLEDLVCVHPPLSIGPKHPLTTELSLSFSPLVRVDSWSVSHRPAKQSYRRIIKDCEAAFAAGVSLTHERLIRKVAEQIGSAHESDKVDVALVDISAVSLAGSGVLSQLLCIDAWLTVEVSEKVLEHAYRELQFARRALSPNDGHLSIAVALGYTEAPSESHTVFVARSDVFRTEIRGVVGPEGFRFLIFRPDCAVAEVALPCPGPCDGEDLHIYVLNYTSRLRKCKWLTPRSSGLPFELDLGWLDPLAFRVRPLGRTFGGTVSFRMTSLFGALLSQDDLRGMCEAPKNTFGLLEDSKVAAARNGFP